MACYGPVPMEYSETDFVEDVVDSTDVTRAGDIAEEEIAGDSLDMADRE